jgi:cell division protein FtsI (penicillin-binding protein 3)
VVVAVTLNGTSGGTQGYGGVVAAPVFREVMTAALRILDVPKDLPDADAPKTNPQSQSNSSISAVDPSAAQKDKTELAAGGIAPYQVWSGPQSVSSVTRPLVQTGTSSPPGGVPGSPGASASPGGSQPESRLAGPGLDQRPFLTAAKQPSSPGNIVPDFRGMSLRAVLEESAAKGLPLEIAGSGLARAQEPAPGTKLRPNEQVKVQFGR